MSKTKVFLISIMILSLSLSGCVPSATPQKKPIPDPTATPQQIAPDQSAESTAVTAAVQSAVWSFLSNDFAAAQKNMSFQPVERSDPHTQRMFTDFSLHLNKRLALQAKDAGLTGPASSVSVANVRATATSGKLADVSIRAAEGLEPLTLIVKTTLVSGAWQVEFASFMLALMDVLDEE